MGYNDSAKNYLIVGAEVVLLANTFQSVHSVLLTAQWGKEDTAVQKVNATIIHGLNYSVFFSSFSSISLSDYGHI